MLGLAWFLKISTFLAFNSAVVGLTCYACGPEKSWEECNSKTRTFNCSAIKRTKFKFDACQKEYKVMHRGNDTIIEFLKMCSTKKICSTLEADCKKQEKDCEVNCCYTDLCNRAHSTTVFTGISGLLFMSFVVILYLR